MKTLALALTAGLTPGLALAQDPRDDDIFGEAAKPSQPSTDTASPSGNTLDRQAKALMDTMQIGGRLELRSSGSQVEKQRFQEGPFTPSKSADLYFDTRPSDEIRVFLRTRFSEQETLTLDSTTGEASRSTSVRTDIDELWFKWDLARTVFVTYGKQHLKWGSGTIWNPTDFTAREVKDPLDLFDRRLGQNLLKIHIPNEKMGFNYYAVLQFDDAERNDDLGLALRGEFAFLGTGELALTAQARRNAPQRLGIDVSSALGPIDVNVEAALSKRQKRFFFEGGSLEDPIVLPTPYQEEDKTFKQVASGVRYAFKYSDDDAIYFGAEYFYNELGYEDRFPELYSLLLRESQNLYAGRRYASAYVRLPTPGDWNKTSFYLTGLGNLSDKTTTARFTGTWLVANYATFEAWAQRCFGDYGELCFKVPENLKDYAANAPLPQSVKNAVSALPTEKTFFTAGVGMSINF